MLREILEGGKYQKSLVWLGLPRAALPRSTSLLWFLKEKLSVGSFKGDPLTGCFCRAGVEILFA